MKLTAAEFKKTKNKRISLLGMSGVGKTHIAKLFNKTNNWFHYCSDYRIGTQYLNDAIIDNIKNRMQKDKWLKTLLKNNSIDINNKISFNNLSSVSSFLGKVGNPRQGGIAIGEFISRQALHKQAEVNAMLDIAKFIKKAEDSGIVNFINDAGGSLCELADDNIYETLAKHTVIIYMKTNKENELALIERARVNPKPMYYQSDFLQKQLVNYLKQKKLSYIAQINPDDFVSWVFPKLLKYRIPKYKYIANTYGYTINCDDLHNCHSVDEVLELIYKTLG